MTTQELQSARRIAALMRAARKRSGLTQIELSSRLGISQSALSKIENGLLIPSAPQWFDFCEFTGISAEALVLGYIERNIPATLDEKVETGFRLPNRFGKMPGSKVRAMLPFLAYFEGVAGRDKLEDYLTAAKVDPDFFVDLDNQISLNFCLDISRRLVADGHLKPKDLSRLVKPVSQGHLHGSLKHFYDHAESTTHRIQALVGNAHQYECNFRYRIEDLNKESIELSVEPEKHLRDLGYRADDVLGDFLCRYKQRYFERFVSYGEQAPRDGTVVEKECQFRGATRCVYHLRVAG